jgi:hypothetical protein
MEKERRSDHGRIVNLNNLVFVVYRRHDTHVAHAEALLGTISGRGEAG